jgi:hypothetical protein
MDDQLYNDPKRLMRRREIAAFHGVVPRTVDRWFASGKLKRVQIGTGISGATRADVVVLVNEGAADAPR